MSRAAYRRPEMQRGSGCFSILNGCVLVQRQKDIPWEKSLLLSRRPLKTIVKVRYDIEGNMNFNIVEVADTSIKLKNPKY